MTDKIVPGDLVTMNSEVAGYPSLYSSVHVRNDRRVELVCHEFYWKEDMVGVAVAIPGWEDAQWHRSRTYAYSGAVAVMMLSDITLKNGKSVNVCRPYWCWSYEIKRIQ